MISGELHTIRFLCTLFHCNDEFIVIGSFDVRLNLHKLRIWPLKHTDVLILLNMWNKNKIFFSSYDLMNKVRERMQRVKHYYLLFDKERFKSDNTD